LNKVSKPDTPHNTTQYLSSNFSQGRNEKVSTIVSEFTPIYDDLQGEMPDDYINQTDDYCVPGGSMRGKIKYFTWHLLDVLLNPIISQQTENKVIVENSISENLAFLWNSPKLYNLQNINDEKVEDLEKYKRVVEQQKSIILILTNLLKKSNSQQGTTSPIEILNKGNP